MGHQTGRPLDLHSVERRSTKKKKDQFSIIKETLLKKFRLILCIYSPSLMVMFQRSTFVFDEFSQVSKESTEYIKELVPTQKERLVIDHQFYNTS